MKYKIKKKRQGNKEENFTGLLFVLPTILIFMVFLYYPFFNGARISFFNYNGIGDIVDFVGFRNFAAVFKDVRFLNSILNTIKLIAIDICVAIPLGFFLAYTLYTRTRFVRFYQFILFIPYIISMVVVGTLWGILYDPTIGPLSTVFKKIGLERLAFPWLGDPSTALYAVALVSVWKVAPFYMMILYSNMMKMPSDFIEAAEIDGAGTLQKIVYIVIPYLGSTFNVLSILAITAAFRAFDLIWVMTQGGPGGATDVTTTYIYRMAFQNYDFGYATALSLFVMVVVMVFLVINNILKRSISKHGQ